MKMMLKSGITLVSDQSGPTENGKQQFSPQSACLSSLHKNFADFHGITMLPVIRSVLSKAIKFWECICNNPSMERPKTVAHIFANFQSMCLLPSRKAVIEDKMNVKQ
ncbi:hypothetical protein T02_14979 [Trichinella nativa]|uniref:Uncharacterized protein n=1 Tax=Trichinella nativa TaxID=6335 RepID=A0A0V1LA23_9BILA|nr:hypothetical protein T02_14979 [Trichinella nativa]